MLLIYILGIGYDLGEDYYLSFGLSGASDKVQMLGADIAVAYIDGYRGYAVDYNITANSPVCILCLIVKIIHIDNLGLD